MIDSEDDDEIVRGRHLGLRGKTEARLRAAGAGIPKAGAIRRITPHSLEGRIEIELPLGLALGRDTPEPIR